MVICNESRWETKPLSFKVVFFWMNRETAFGEAEHSAHLWQMNKAFRTTQSPYTCIFDEWSEHALIGQPKQMTLHRVSMLHSQQKIRTRKDSVEVKASRSFFRHLKKPQLSNYNKKSELYLYRTKEVQKQTRRSKQVLPFQLTQLRLVWGHTEWGRPERCEIWPESLRTPVLSGDETSHTPICKILKGFEEKLRLLDNGT